MPSSPTPALDLLSALSPRLAERVARITRVADREAVAAEVLRVQSRPPEALRLPMPDSSWPKYLYRGASR